MYRTIDAAFWTDPKVKKLDSAGKLLFLYLITNPNTHVSGIYVLPLRYAAADLGISLNTLSANLDTLSGLGLCAVDRATEVVWVRNMMRFQGRGEKNLKSAAYHVAEDLHGSYLCDQFLDEYPEVAKFTGRPKKDKRESIPKDLRYLVLERDLSRCVRCGATAETASLEVDHIIPVSRGGLTEIGNLQTLCQPCNLGKSDRVSIGVPEKSSGATPESPFPIPEQEQEYRTGKPPLPPFAEKRERPRDGAADLFASSYQENIGNPYGWNGGDFPQLAKLRKRLGLAGTTTPDSWEEALLNYFATPLKAFSLQHFAAEFDTFKNSPLDRFNRPVNHVNGGSNGKPREVASDRAAKDFISRELAKTLRADVPDVREKPGRLS